MRRLIYKEDDQLYYFTPIIFETDATISVKEMSDISYESNCAGRFSTSFEHFKMLMEKHGYVVIELERLDIDTIPENNTLEIVDGATGNY